MGNAADPASAPVAERLLGDRSPLVRAMAVWALSRILDGSRFETLRERNLPTESDPDVREEWTAHAEAVDRRIPARAPV